MARPNFTHHWWMPNGVYVRKLDRGNRPFVLKTIIKEAVRYGRCVLPRKKLADLAMSDPSTIDATIKLAVDAKLMMVDGDEIWTWVGSTISGRSWPRIAGTGGFAYRIEAW